MQSIEESRAGVTVPPPSHMTFKQLSLLFTSSCAAPPYPRGQVFPCLLTIVFIHSFIQNWTPILPLFFLGHRAGKRVKVIPAVKELTVHWEKVVTTAWEFHSKEGSHRLPRVLVRVHESERWGAQQAQGEATAGVCGSECLKIFLIISY